MKKLSFLLIFILIFSPILSIGINNESNISSLPLKNNIVFNKISYNNHIKYDFGENIIEKKDDVFILYDKNSNIIDEYSYINSIVFENNLGYLVRKNNVYYLIDRFGTKILDNDKFQKLHINENSLSFLVDDNVIFINKSNNSLEYNILNDKNQKTLTVNYINNISNKFISLNSKVYDLEYFNSLIDKTFDKIEFIYDYRYVFNDTYTTFFKLYKNNLEEGFGFIDCNGNISNIILKSGKFNFIKNDFLNINIVNDILNKNIYIFRGKSQLFKDKNIKEFIVIDDILVFRTNNEFLFVDEYGYLINSYKSNKNIFLDYYKDKGNILFIISDSNKPIESFIINNNKLIYKSSSLKDSIITLDDLVSYQNRTLDVYFNNSKVNFFKSNAILYNNNSYIPLREFVFLTNSSLIWNNDTKETIVVNDNKVIKINKNIVNIYDNDNLTETFKTNIINDNGNNLVKIVDFKNTFNLNLNFKNNSLYIEKLN